MVQLHSTCPKEVCVCVCVLLLLLLFYMHKTLCEIVCAVIVRGRLREEEGVGEPDEVTRRLKGQGQQAVARLGPAPSKMRQHQQLQP